MFQPELRHFRYMAALADELHFGRAAAKVGIAQPPFSQQIQALERALGHRLVERKPVVRLTPAGEAFVDTGRRALAQVQAGLEATRRIGAGEVGTVRVGFAASTLMTRVPSALRAFRQAYPEVEVDLRELSTAMQIKALAAGELDVGVTREVQDAHPSVACEVLGRENLIGVLPPAHRFSHRKRVHLAELKNDPFVLFPEKVAPGLHATVARLFRESGFTPRVTMEALEWVTIVGLVEAGAGVSVVPQSFERLRLGDAVYVRLQADAVTTSVTLCAAKTSGAPAAARFAQAVREAFAA